MKLLWRIALFVFGVAGVVCLLALSLPWFGPWTKGATALMGVSWYFSLVEGTLIITALGVLVALGRAVLTPSTRKTVVVTKANGDQVTVTTAAISSQVAHIVEENRDYFAEKVWVTARGRNRVRVAVRVRPAYSIDVVEEGKRLHDELMDGLSALCGKSIDKLELEFVEADSLDPKPEYLSYVPEEPAQVLEAEVDPLGAAAGDAVDAGLDWTGAVKGLSGSVKGLFGSEKEG